MYEVSGEALEKRSPSPVETIPSLETAGSIEELSEQYSPEYIARLVINSFRFSQGMGGIQHSIMAYMAHNFGERFSPEAIEASIPIASQTAMNIRNNSAVHAQTYKSGRQMEPIPLAEAETQVKTYTDSLNKHLEKDGPFKSINFLTYAVIARDYNSLAISSDKSGRDRSGHNASSPYRDKYFSSWVYFGLMSQTTGMPEYDQMFADMVEVYKDTEQDLGYEGLIKDDDVRSEAEQLIEFYVMRHPDQLSLLPEQFRPALD